MDVIALLVAGGSGERVGRELPKQYLPLKGIPMLRRTIMQFIDNKEISDVCVVIRPQDRALYEEATKGLRLLPAIEGGATRQISVYRGLQALQKRNPTHVLIHDACRPWVSPLLIKRVIAALAEHDAVVPVLPLVDTIKQMAGEFIATTIDRNQLRIAQTPQGFRYEMITSLHARYADTPCTDDAMLCEQAGKPVATVMGDRMNQKITTQEDLAEERIMRVGMGYDVHRFRAPENGEEGHVMLCGVRVLHSVCIEAHSDGDVGLHALTDALLGAMAEGDIGMLFPPSDPTWKGADSAQFIDHVMGMLRARQGVIHNADITIICEAPKVGPNRVAMQKRVAELLGIRTDCVNIKATTTEKLGFTGRREGIAAQAVVLVKI